MGSWKIMAMSFPRIRRISASESLVRSRTFPSFPRNKISPPTILPGGEGMSRMIANEVTLFPLPDSPTTARVSPLFT